MTRFHSEIKPRNGIDDFLLAQEECFLVYRQFSVLYILFSNMNANT